LRERLTALYASQPRQHWVQLLEGSDACFAPAPRFSATPAGEIASVPQSGEHDAQILRELGLSDSAIEQLL